MGTVVWHGATFERHVERAVVKTLDKLGADARDLVRSLTPWRTGYAWRSVWYVVLDPQGRRVAGDERDRNGVAVPRFPGTGKWRVVLGANAPYYLWLEIGSRGRAGGQMLAQGQAYIRREFVARLRRAGIGAP